MTYKGRTKVSRTPEFVRLIKFRYRQNAITQHVAVMPYYYFIHFQVLD